MNKIQQIYPNNNLWYCMLNQQTMGSWWLRLLSSIPKRRCSKKLTRRKSTKFKSVLTICASPPWTTTLSCISTNSSRMMKCYAISMPLVEEEILFNKTLSKMQNQFNNITIHKLKTPTTPTIITEALIRLKTTLKKSSSIVGSEPLMCLRNSIHNWLLKSSIKKHFISIDYLRLIFKLGNIYRQQYAYRDIIEVMRRGSSSLQCCMSNCKSKKNSSTWKMNAWLNSGSLSKRLVDCSPKSMRKIDYSNFNWRGEMIQQWWFKEQ